MDIISSINNNRTFNKHGVKIALGGAVLCLLIMLLHVGLTLRTQHKIKISNYEPKPAQAIRRNAQQLYRANDIISANLFGDPSPVEAVKVTPKTTLDLTLQGVLWGTDEKIGRAIIKSGKKKPKLYSVGDDIKGAGASVKEIKNGEVLLNRNGATESLPLIKKTSSGNNQLITYVGENHESDRDDLDFQDDGFAAPESRQIKRTTPRPRSENGEPRKIRKPNFSGLDRALRKMDEI